MIVRHHQRLTAGGTSPDLVSSATISRVYDPAEAFGAIRHIRRHVADRDSETWRPWLPRLRRQPGG